MSASAERLAAPELDGATAWLNVEQPPRLADLRGRVVILDFWTHCCINCLHVIPVLADLEERRAEDPLAVIGVHSAKFDAEREPARIRAALERHGVRHPVAVDSRMRIWQRYGVRSWPTLAVIRPDGTLAALAPGEPDAEALDDLIGRLLEEGRSEGTLADGPASGLAPRPGPSGGLRFPGRAITAPDGRIFVADSGQNRVLVCDPSGQVQTVIGSGLRGLQDGALETAALDDPQGLAFDAGGEALYIADTRNHAIRRADLRAGALATIAGTGQMGRSPLAGPLPARVAELRSPWDLALDGERLYVALAGSHQLGVVDLARGTIARLAGSGREELSDGPAATAALAQPSGLALAGGRLYFADSEVSAVRVLQLDTEVVRTLAGAGLFEFGHADGAPETARFQHCLGVVATPGGLIVADTYNDALRRVDPDSGEVQTLLGAGTLSEPGGLALTPDGDLLVCDTNNHRLVRIGPGGEVLGEVVVSGAPTPLTGAGPRAAGAPPAEPIEGRAYGEPIADRGLAGGRGELLLTLIAPEGFEFAEGGPIDVRVATPRRGTLVTLLADRARGSIDARVAAVTLRVPLEARGEGRAPVLVTAQTVVCDGADRGVCVPLDARFQLEVRVGGREVTDTYRASLVLPAPAPAR